MDPAEIGWWSNITIIKLKTNTQKTSIVASNKYSSTYAVKFGSPELVLDFKIYIFIKVEEEEEGGKLFFFYKMREWSLSFLLHT